MKTFYKISILLLIVASCSHKVAKTKTDGTIPNQTNSNSSSSSKLVLHDGELKVGGLGLAELYYGFAEGDKIILTVTESSGRQISDVLVQEYPKDTMYKARLVKEIVINEIKVTNTGVYYFRFSNAFGEGRIYNVKIERAFTNKKYESFNSKVYWKQAVDSIWHNYPTRVVTKSDTILNTLIDEEVLIQAKNDTINFLNRENRCFNLPNLTKGWGYYIGAGAAGKSNFMSLKNAYETNPNFNQSKIIQNGIMASVLMRKNDLAANVKCNQIVKYWFTDSKSDANNFMEGKYFSSFRDSSCCIESKKMSYPSNGQICIELLNESNGNAALPVYLNVASISINEQYETKPVHKFRLVNVQKPYLVNK